MAKVALAIAIAEDGQQFEPYRTCRRNMNRERTTMDNEIRQRKNECYSDVESGLWGWQCKSSMIAKENCVLKCLSPACYELVYESDPLEEGEKDFIRSQEYKYCMHRAANTGLHYSGHLFRLEKVDSQCFKDKLYRAG
ncbi:hypothetical protein L1049_028404 [Liquidambar formosana]|uniref:Uncharacterized protein n=1 Tax=Liquidambar formosana TaxID=63359 RepID=A0AAP0RKV1_LIQFO